MRSLDSWLPAERAIFFRTIAIARVLFTLEFGMSDWPVVVADSGTAIGRARIAAMNSAGKDDAGLDERPPMHRGIPL